MRTCKAVSAPSQKGMRADVLAASHFVGRRDAGAECLLPMVKHVLVVDDDPAMRDVVGNYLENHNFRVSLAADGQTMKRVLADRPVDLMILDLKLAGEDGLELMRGIGEQTDVPIIVLTGHRRDETDRVVGLELGADDYMMKPFGLRELLARIRAVLRRAQAGERRSRQMEKRVRYRFAGWELSLRTRQLVSPTGAATALTAGEFNLLTAFLRSPQQVLSREQLLAASRVHDEEVFDRSVDIQILRLRRKLEADPSEPQLIRTERGAGYVFAAPVEIL
jgi:two-component system OmpR family response regulator